MAKKKALWLKNNTGSDVSLSDLGVKVLANQTTNVYAYNPYITTEQVKKSMEDGSISKRLESKVLSVVKGVKKPRPHNLDHVKTSSGVVEVVKSKTAVFINTKDEDVINDEDLGDIADYGLGELGHTNTTNVRTEDGSIVVKQKEDEPEDEVSDAIVQMEKVKSASNVSNQSVVAITKQVESQSDPVGPMAPDTSLPDQPFVVVRPPEDPEPQQATAIQEAEAKLKSMTKIKKVGDTIVVDGKTAGGRNLKAIAADDPEAADADSVIKDESKYDAQVATKDESGAIVMKVKEVTEKETTKPKTEKPKVVKVAKKKAKKKTGKKPSKKKTSKKKTS
jgi:hypothetical protein